MIDVAREVLAKTGFYLSERMDTRRISFDLIARRDDMLLVTKVLLNIDSMGRKRSQELKMIASCLEGAPLLLADRSGAGKLENGAIYSRFGIPILSMGTFRDIFLEGVPPFMFSAPGGLYVKLDGSVIRSAREHKNISLGTLAEIAGVSRRTIQMYEDGMGATVDVALKLEEFLGVPIVQAVDPFHLRPDADDIMTSWNQLDQFDRDVFNHLSQLGYSIVPTIRCPFDAETRDRKVILLTGLEREQADLSTKAKVVANISSVVEKDSVIFVRRLVMKENIEGTPIIRKEELKKLKNRDAMLDLISERKK
jgi:putative transcriptional regulator